MQYDTSLIKIIHTEIYKGLKISASLTRFGGLYVCVQTTDHDYVFDATNILDARSFVDSHIKNKDNVKLAA